MLIGLLWVGQVVLFAIGLVGPWRDASEHHRNGRVAWPIRMVLSLSLVAAALLIWWRGGEAVGPYTRWVALGMTASFAGDLIMARLIRLPNRLIGGMAAFGLAHACYITGYVQTIRGGGAVVGNAGLWAGLVFYMLATLSAWALLIRNRERPAIVNVGALLYGLWIGVMASTALALAVGLGGGWWLAAAGGLCFVASDFLIGMTDIGGVPLRHANDWIWLTYLAGQMGIIYAAWM